MAEEIQTIDGAAARGTTEYLGANMISSMTTRSLRSTHIYEFQAKVLQFGLEKSEVGRYVVSRVGLAANGMFGVGKSRHTRHQDILCKLSELK